MPLNGNPFLIVYEGTEMWLHLASGPEAHHHIVRHWQLVSVFLSDLNSGKSCQPSRWTHRKIYRQTDRHTHSELSYNSQLVCTADI